ncbi:type II toxin-antitoxin system Phd/YefM family antitoxin [Yimella sp. RIT 621]|nr:type II toxin-antitoxin system Phd/YefM family antitoxin [Yimella sp. RIT 621]
MTTMSAREFNRDVSVAKRDAARGPVVITDRGEPAFVLLSIQEYRRLLLLRQPVPERVLTVRVVQQVQVEFVAEALEGRTAADAGAVGVQPR